MVALSDVKRDVVLFSPTESLLLQLAKWAGKHRGVELRLVSSTLPGNVNAALETAAFSIIDATIHPRTAMAILARGVERLGPGKVAVYTEIMQEGVEVFTRTRGAVLLLGPISPDQWEALFENLEPATVPLNTSH